MTRVVIAILFSLFCLQVGIAAQTPSIRVMTFNIRYDEPRDGVNAWPKRKQKVADVIRFHKADIIGVQEALLTQLRDLEKLLPDFAWVGVGRADGKESGEYSAILYRKARFRVIASDTFWLSETPDKVGSKGWDAALPRIVTWAKLEDRVSGKTFVHFNTHFDHVGEKARAESASLILKKAGEIHGKGSFVVTGDFNVCVDSGAYKTIIAGTPAIKLVDARYASVNGHFGGDSTFNGFKELEPGRTIDYIFVRDGIKVLEHGTLSDRWDGLWASDHLPVIAEIVIN
jgi:endonuclease/exonuclease/phosphatase family metal-dependent hydrolase